ncbi:MAG: pyridoxal phosphate-dependent aminotransferase [Candidatus Gracilibacteria bacterium]|nr:pyridoxal phosphate-dependent aminotransferase [Candidatus Gracilibacteria bacterium]
MRKNLLHIGHNELSYEIREIVAVAYKIRSFGREIFWENIGDPVAKGEHVPDWIKDIVKEALNHDEVYGYCPTRGLDKTREYIASKNPKITKDNILFFNGLGDAINKIYRSLAFDSRVIGPNPAYSTHSSAEAAHAGTSHITYSLDPKNNWNPDLEELENKVKYNPNIVAILVINPDNPTGAVFSREVLESIVDIANRYNLFLVFDEIYEKLTYDEDDRILLSDVIGEVPGISMKGISKDLPWPGSRCGWIEVYNEDKDENFKQYISSILSSKMLEVCSTTLPQYVLPKLYECEYYKISLKERILKYKTRADLAEKILGGLDEVTLIKPKGAFYMSITFNMENIDLYHIPDIKECDIKEYVTDFLSGVTRFDKKFCYYLLAKTGVCTVPLSGFNSNFEGFRVTLLEEDEQKFILILEKIKEFIKEFKK